MPTKILVVDDEPQLERLILQRLRRKIRDKSYEFTFALNGVEALEKLEEHDDIEIILSDINMPKMDGLTLLSKLDSENKLLKTVMVSAYGDMQNLRTAMNRGAYDFVIKPIDFNDLELTINKATAEIEQLKEAERARHELEHVQKELNIASEVQQAILPRNFSIIPQNAHFELYAEMIPAKEVGGDFYDFFRLGDEHLAFVIGDVSGKGTPAALFMAISRTLLKATALKGMQPKECIEQVNYLLSQDNPRAMFVTLFYGILDFRSGAIEYINAGHNPPVLFNSNGKAEYLSKSKNMALCLLEDFRFESGNTRLDPNDGILLYTDGITEAMDQARNEFSDQRLLDYVQTVASRPVREIVDGVVREVQRFSDGTEQFDDITALAIRRPA